MQRTIPDTKVKVMVQLQYVKINVKPVLQIENQSYCSACGHRCYNLCLARSQNDQVLAVDCGE